MEIVIKQISIKKEIIITILKCYLLINTCYCGELGSGLYDSVEGTIQLLSGINKILATRNQIIDPVSITADIADEIVNKGNSSTLEKLYEKFFLPSNSTIENTENNNNNNTENFNNNNNNNENTNNSNNNIDKKNSYNKTFLNLNDILQNILNPSPVVYTTDPGIYTEDSTDYPTDDPLTYAPTQSAIMLAATEGIIPQFISPEVTEEPPLNDKPAATVNIAASTIGQQKVNETIKTELDVPLVTEEIPTFINQNVGSSSSNYSTFEKFLSIQDNVCYKVKYGIESITNSQLIILFSKFLEYEYLKAKESWERITLTANKIWESAVYEEPRYSRLYRNKRIEQFLYIIDITKNQIKQCFNILKSPFSLILKGIKAKFVKTVKDEDKRDFCEKFNELERNLRDSIINLEDKINKKLDSEIKKENELLTEGKINPEKLLYFDKDAISNDIRYIKERINEMYDYFKTAASNQLNRLMKNKILYTVL